MAHCSWPTPEMVDEALMNGDRQALATWNRDLPQPVTPTEKSVISSIICGLLSGGGTRSRRRRITLAPRGSH